MTTRNTPFAPGTPCWVDLTTSDVDKAAAFYSSVFGWTYEPGPEEFGGYGVFRSDGHQVAGMMKSSPDLGSPDVWSTYIATADIDASVAAARAGGGQVMADPMAVADLGSMAVLVDPAGAVFGLWQAGKHTGFEKYNEPGSVTWDEHHSKDFTTSTDFYTRLFGWDIDPMSDTDAFRYSTAQVDGQTVAGLMDSKGILPDDVPSHWAVYFSVADVDATSAQLGDIGGVVVRPAEDTPFGRVADAVDPTGTPFKLHTAPADQS